MSANKEPPREPEQHPNHVNELDKHDSNVLVLSVNVNSPPVIETATVTVSTANEPSPAEDIKEVGTALAESSTTILAFAECLDCTHNEVFDVLEKWVDMRQRGKVADLLIDTENNTFEFRQA